jgi:hypothetical protein
MTAAADLSAGRTPPPEGNRIGLARQWYAHRTSTRPLIHDRPGRSSLESREALRCRFLLSTARHLRIEGYGRHRRGTGGWRSGPSTAAQQCHEIEDFVEGEGVEQTFRHR